MGHITRAWCTFNDISGHGDNTALWWDSLVMLGWRLSTCATISFFDFTASTQWGTFAFLNAFMSPTPSITTCALCFFFFFPCCACEFCTTQEQAYWVAWFALLPRVSSCLPCVQGMHDAFPCAAAKLLCCKPRQDHLCCWETLVAVAAMSVACLPVSECCNEQG